MITEHSVYRFANGIRKDLPLNDKGIPWEISTREGKKVALFSDGTLAEFYIDAHQVAQDLKKADALERATALANSEWPVEFDPPMVRPDVQTCVCGYANTCPIHGDGPPPVELKPTPIQKQAEGFEKPKRRRKPSNAGFFERALKTKLPESDEAKIIGRYKTVEGQNPLHEHEPVFCVFAYKNTERSLLCNYDRATVGTGLREYLWLYQTLRSMGRGRWASMREAIQIYFL